jgi:hypothetical protein
MTTRISAADARALLAKPKQLKYRNMPTVYDGVTYASKLEASHAAALDLLKRSGHIRGWASQVSIPLPAIACRIRIDFMVVRPDGSVALQDTKGVMTRDWQRKTAACERQLGIPIEIIRRTR